MHLQFLGEFSFTSLRTINMIVDCLKGHLCILLNDSIALTVHLANKPTPAVDQECMAP